MRYKEASEQMTLIAWMNLKHPRIAHLLSCYPAGVCTDARTGARMKALGLRKGWPDLFLARPTMKSNGETSYGLFIELKADKKHARVSKEQKFYIDELREQGYSANICYGINNAIDCIERYLKTGE